MQSLGNSLYAFNETKDFDLIITDDVTTIHLLVHRLVLKCSSPFFRRILGGHHLFCYVWTVPKYTIHEAVNIIKYMYDRNYKILDTDCGRILSLQLEMKILYSTLQYKHKKKENKVLTQPRRQKYYNTRSMRPMKLRRRT